MPFYSPVKGAQLVDNNRSEVHLCFVCVYVGIAHVLVFNLLIKPPFKMPFVQFCFLSPCNGVMEQFLDILLVNRCPCNFLISTFHHRSYFRLNQGLVFAHSVHFEQCYHSSPLYARVLVSFCMAIDRVKL